LEVYLRVPLDELKRRDPKGLYQRAAAGQASGVVGMDLEYDEPVSPHLLIDNTPPATTIAAVERILRAARPLLVGA
jgi:adenylylsulfate kinase